MKKCICFLMVVTMFSCTKYVQKTQQQGNDFPADSLTEVYENEYFSIMYPQEWQVVWNELELDSMGLAILQEKHNVRGGTATIWNDDIGCWFSIVKAVSGWISPNSTPKDWCELSQYARQQEMACIGMSEVTDSITISGCPAAEVRFWYVYDIDTLVHVQYAIIPQYGELYYANIEYRKGNTLAYYTGWKMLNTLFIKRE